jgi:two-component system sensor histidine kinase YesM
MKIKYFFKKYIVTPMFRSLRMKLFLLTLLVGIVPLVVATFISRQNSQDAMRQEIIKQNLSKIEWVDSEFYNNVDRIDEALTAFFFDSNILFYSSKVEENDSWKTVGIQYFRTKLKSYLLANYRDFVTVKYYTFESNRVFSVSFEKDFFIEDITDDALKQNPLFNHEGGLFYNIQTGEMGQSIDGPYLTKLYRRFDNQEIIGALVVKLNWNLFAASSQLLTTEKDSRVFFIDNEGRIIYQSNNMHYANNQFENIFQSIKKTEDGDFFVHNDEYVFYRKLSESLYLVKTMPTSIATEFYKEILSSQLLIIFVTGFIIFGIILFFSAQLTKPIRTLTKSMQNIDGILEGEELPIMITKTNDEIKVLEQSYRFMIHKIRDLIDKEYKQRIETQSAQLMALQAQINPHFMYNTLQMIGTMAVDKEAIEIYQVISAYSKMMRYNMQLTEELVTVDQEINNVQQYIQIQQMRFGEQLSIHTQIEPLTIDLLIPKLSIQPIVENCFKYGFIKREIVWNIHIKTWIESENLFIEISDNGIGISKKHISEIFKNLSGENQLHFYNSDHLGLRNIDSRIKMHFGKEYGLKVESEKDKYTRITIVMKATNRSEV